MLAMSFSYLILRPDARSHLVHFTSITLTFVKDLSFIFWATYPSSTPAFFVIADGGKQSIEPVRNRNDKKELRSGRVADSSSKQDFLLKLKFPFLFKSLTFEFNYQRNGQQTNYFSVYLRTYRRQFWRQCPWWKRDEMDRPGRIRLCKQLVIQLLCHSLRRRNPVLSTHQNRGNCQAGISRYLHGNFQYAHRYRCVFQKYQRKNLREENALYYCFCSRGRKRKICPSSKMDANHGTGKTNAGIRHQTNESPPRHRG